MIHYNEVKTFIETYHRNPSKYVDSERGLRNWVKQQKKLLNAGALEGQRLLMFNELLGLGRGIRGLISISKPDCVVRGGCLKKE